MKDVLPELSTVIPQQELGWIVKFMEHFLEKIKHKQISEEEVSRLYYLLYYYWQESQ